MERERDNVQLGWCGIRAGLMKEVVLEGCLGPQGAEHAERRGEQGTGASAPHENVDQEDLSFV